MRTSPVGAKDFSRIFRPYTGYLPNDTITTAFGRGYDLSPRCGSIRTRLSQRHSDLLAIHIFNEQVTGIATQALAPDRCPAGRHGRHESIIAELPKIVPNSYVISSKGCECRSDHLHFTPAGYRELGRRYAERMVELA